MTESSARDSPNRVVSLCGCVGQVIAYDMYANYYFAAVFVLKVFFGRAHKYIPVR